MTPRYAFGCAAGLYHRGVHPRVLVSPDDLPLLRRKLRQGVCRKIMEAMRSQLRPLVEQMLAGHDLKNLLAHRELRQGRGDSPVLQRLHDLALVGVLDEDAGTLDAVRRALLGLPEAEDLSTGFWCSPRYHHVGTIAYAYDLVQPLMSDADQRTFLRWALDCSLRLSLEQIRGTHYLRTAGMNIPVVGMITALSTLLAIEGDPGVPDLARERAELLTYFEATLHTALGPAGYPMEDTGYGTAIVPYLMPLVDAVRRAGLYDAYASCPRVRRFGEALLHLVQPWGEVLSNTGDNTPDVLWREWALARLASENADPTLLWLLGTLRYPAARFATPYEGNDVHLASGVQVPATAFGVLAFDPALRGAVHPGKARAPTAFRDPARGLVTFRSGWDADATYVLFDGCQRSPSCQGHDHASGGHFGLTALGEYFGIDMGRYGTEQSEHNVVLVDGKSARSTEGEWGMVAFTNAVLTEYRPGPFCDIAAVDSSVQHNCYWARRHLGLVKGRGAPAYVWTVEDVNKANDFREFWWTLNTSPENTIETFGDHATLTGWRHGNRLDVHFALPDPKTYPKPHTLILEQDEPSTSSYKYITNARERVKDYARPAEMVNGHVFVRPRLIAKVSGYNGRFMSVMLPRRKGETPATVEVLPTLDNALAVRLTFERVADTLVWAYEHNLLEADGIVGRGNWCVVRRDRKTRRVLAHELGSGTCVTVDGKSLRV